MIPAHHPRETSLEAYAAGTLCAGPRLVLATHMVGCPRCRSHVRACESLGGALLDGETPAVISTGLLARTLAKRNAVPPPSLARARRWVPPELTGAPAPLLECDIGPWRFLQPGVRYSRVTLPREAKANVILLKFGAGRRAPQHSHEGAEFTQILKGAYSDELGLFQAGDCIEADAEIDHEPAVAGDTECICLAAVEGKLKLHSWMGRLVQPLLGL